MARSARLSLALLLALFVPGLPARAKAPAAPQGAAPALSPALLKLRDELVKQHGPAIGPRLERGLAQVAALFRPTDGDLGTLVRRHFIVEEAQRQATLTRLEGAFEQLDGHFNEIARELRRPSDLDVGPLLPVDPLLAAYDPAAHTTEDLFRAQVAFVALLNFPLTTLDERLGSGERWSRADWAAARLTGRFARRVPAQVQQEITEAAAAAELYIAEYNLWMHHLLAEDGRRLFPKGLRLITHWNLRDELKADYADPKDGLAKQRLIVRLMERIVTQTIPQAVIDNPGLDWNPFTNAVTVAPAAEVEADAPARPAAAKSDPEPDTRYARLLANFRAARKADPFSPVAPTAIARSFEVGRELPEARVVALLKEILESPRVPEVAALIERRLGRKLGPQDLWYSGFQARAKFPEADLDALTRRRYPDAPAFAADLPRLLRELGFTAERAKYLAERIVVDPSRGAGHALQANRRGDLPHLRTRIDKGGMTYKGYNIAVHELGHNVEQLFSLYHVDHTLLQGVPNNAFTEALAFVFQARDLELLGLAKPDVESERLRVLGDFWATWEIAGVALVDLAVWHWLYEHPEATPTELREATVAIAKEHWNRYYAKVLGAKDSPLLGIYSHMISYPLYVTDYPIGHLIAFQIEEHLKKKGGPLGGEFERMASFGAVTPDRWLVHATGAPVSTGPLLRATAAALQGGPAKR